MLIGVAISGMIPLLDDNLKEFVLFWSGLYSCCSAITYLAVLECYIRDNNETIPDSNILPFPDTGISSDNDIDDLDYSDISKEFDNYIFI